MHRHLIRSAVFLSLFTASLFATELYEDKQVSQIEVVVDGTASSDVAPVLSRLKTKQGDTFSQLTFDTDLKTLAENYDKVEPEISSQNGQLVIVIHVTPRPLIHAIEFSGNEKFSDGTLRSELDIHTATVFNRQEFNKAFNKLKDYYFKKGYFEAQLDYTVVPTPDHPGEADIEIRISEGRPGLVKNIRLHGFSSDEETALEDQMALKTYNFITSWLTGTGIYRDEALEQDKVTIINYLQNKGYADAKVDIALSEDPVSGKLLIDITAEKGSLYHVGEVHVSGNVLFNSDEILKKAGVAPGDVYSPEKVRDAVQAIKDLYGHKGYIEANVQSETALKENDPAFDVDFTVEEGGQYKIGLIHIFGNTATQNNVILRESLLVPGETFDSRKLKATQQRLEAVGYFKCVNVYAVRTADDETLGENYRDVYIQVEETSTGNISLFAGFSSTDDVSGGLELTERNFHLAHVGKALTGKLSSLRGGGEYFHVRGTAGKKQNNVLVSWLNPYVNDSLWRFGVDLSYTYSKLQNNVKVITYGGSVYTSYPITNYWTAGFRERLRHSNDSLDLDQVGYSPQAKAYYEMTKQTLDQKGLISAVSGNISYDSIDNPFKPHRGWRSYFEAEMSGVGGNYVFGKLSYLNSIYFPIWSRGTLKLRADFKYLHPFGKTDKAGVPYSERFFLGGDTSMRGYKPFMVGPQVKLLNDEGKFVDTSTPLGGLASALVSLEYNQNIFKMLDVFGFFDAGTVNFGEFLQAHPRATAGGGLRLDIGNRTPIMIGWGHAFCRGDRKDHKTQTFFFSMGGQF